MTELKLTVTYDFLEAIRNHAQELSAEPLQLSVDLLSNHLLCQSELIKDAESYAKAFKCTDYRSGKIKLVLPLSDDVFEALNDAARTYKVKLSVLAVRFIANELGYEEEEESDEEDYKQLGYDHPEDILYEMFGITDGDDMDLEDALDCWNND